MSTQLGPLAECRSCHEPIRFVALDSGKALPVNPAHNPAGNVAARMTGGRLTGFVISRDKRPGPMDPYRFLAHHATCSERPRPAKREPDPALF